MQSFGTPQKFAGTLASPGDPRPITVSIEVDGSGVIATLPDGARCAITFADLVMESGGFEGDFLFLKPKSGAFVVTSNAKELGAAIAYHGGGTVEGAMAGVASQRRGRDRWRTIGIIATTSVIVLVAGFLVAIPYMLAAMIDFVPIEVDRRIGDSAYESEGAALGAPVHDPTIDAFVAAVLARLQPHSADPRHELRPVVVANADINAFALPGGRIVIFTGLLAAAENESEVAGVLAHEIAHVTQRHGLGNAAHNVGAWVVLGWLFGDAGTLGDVATQLGLLTASNAYSRDQEAEADEEGVRTLVAASIDPHGLSRFFRTMQRQEGADAEVLEWLSTHPDTDSRIAHVEELARGFASGSARPLGVDYAAVRSAATAIPTPPPTPVP